MVYKKPILIYNPYAGEGKSKSLLIKYIEKLNKELFANVELLKCNLKSELVKIIKEIHFTKSNDLIISVGGDGTISSMINALMEIPKNERIPLFPLPSGSGDSFLKEFNVRNINDAIRNFKSISSPKYSDIMLVEDVTAGTKRYCINIVGMGYVSNLAYYAERYGRQYGSFSYFMGAIYGLKQFKSYKIKIKYKLNGKEEVYQSDKVYFLTVSNTKFTGGTVKIAPDAIFDDGIMDIIILHDINRFGFLSGYISAFRGKHIYNKGCTYLKATDVEIEVDSDFLIMSDGDLSGSKSPLKISLYSKEIPITI
ncbi:MAG: hypothetical protein A2086_00310 [Spirochaetes bacterium GWD1_27_9]|nr:MAG: hypothetical protein A2086_00310 [Spirochaetes bacterium GWD1_27_9]